MSAPEWADDAAEGDPEPAPDAPDELPPEGGPSDVTVTETPGPMAWITEPTADVELDRVRESFGVSTPVARVIRVAASAVRGGEAVIDPDTDDGGARPSRGADLLAAAVSVLRARVEEAREESTDDEPTVREGDL